MRIITVVAIAVFAAACQEAQDVPPAPAGPSAAGQPAAQPGPDKLAAILAAQPDEVRARYAHRHPQETLTFFGIEPGMTVVEGLPGQGWYTKILLPYLGKDGRLIVANYAMDMWPLFQFANEEFLERQSRWIEDFTASTEEWRDTNSATVSAFYFGSMDAELAGSADAVLFIRVLHNLARFESEGDFLNAALADAFNVLKPGGILGVVQHHARDDMPDDWADGSYGYLKKSFVIDRVEDAGFEFVAESDVNANDKDRPTTEDFVWRLPPSYFNSQDDPELRAKMDAIGETNRLTLLFRKPR